MARVTHVKKAQQRYETVPVLDADGHPVKIALTKADGTPKTTSAKKGSRPIFITKTVADKTRPRPNLRCDFAGCQITDREILPGQGYKWIKPKSGPYGGTQKNRHAEHPSWNVWEYSNSLSARVAQIENDATLDGVESLDDAQAVASEAAEAIRGLAEEKRESASNIEEGFGHATYQSEELESQADELDGWADEVEATEFPDPEDAEYLDQDEVDCDECHGSGLVDNDNEDTLDDEPEVECVDCGGTGQVENEDPETDWDAWRDAAAEALSEALGSCPV